VPEGESRSVSEDPKPCATREVLINVLAALLAAGILAGIAAWWHNRHPSFQVTVQSWTVKDAVGSQPAQAQVVIINGGQNVEQDCVIRWMVEEGTSNTGQLIASSEGYLLSSQAPQTVELTQPQVQPWTIGKMIEEPQILPTFVYVQCGDNRSPASSTKDVRVEADSPGNS
jgi:hypothetical protein